MNGDRLRAPRSRMRPVPGVLPAALLGGLALTCGVALTTTSGWLIVAASYQPQILTLLAAIVLVRAFGIARPALRYAERIRSHDAALAYLAEERARTYARLVPLTPARLGRRSRGEILTGVVDDLDDIAYAQVRFIVPMVALLVSGLLAAFADALILLPAAAVTLSAVFFTLLVGWADLTVEKHAHTEVVSARAEMGRLATMVAANGMELAAIGARDQALHWVDEAQSRLSRALVRQAWGRAFGVCGMPLVTVIHTVAMIAVVAPWVQRGLPAPLAAFLLLTPVALGEVVAGVPDAVGALARARGADQRLNALLTQRPAVRDPESVSALRQDMSRGGSAAAPTPRTDPSATDPAVLGLDHVSASWDEERIALPQLSTTIRPGVQLAIVGPNGSGKSTLLAVLARHLDPATGSYTVDGRDTSRISLAEVRAQLAVVDDEPHVFASTLRENLRFASPECTDEQIERALRLAGLSAWYADLPDGLDTRLGTDGQGISGGERARLGIARALLSERKVLLLDEPVAHLDRPTATAVLADVREASAGRTVIMVSHRDEGVASSDEVLRLGPVPRVPPPVAGPR